MNQDFMKEKPILPLVISMALPMSISMLVNALYNIIDSYFVARISEDTMTALSLVYPIQNAVNSVAVGFGIGINAAIAYYLGAKNRQLANRAASVGIFLNVIHGILLTIVSMVIMPMFLRLFTKDEQIITSALDYSYIVFAFCIPIMASVSLEKIFQAVGQMKTSMVCMLIGCVVNIILDPVLIFGIGFLPRLGIRGAAIATGIGQVASLVAYIVIYFVRPIPVKITRKDIKFEKKLCKKLYLIGMPATLNMALPSLQVSALNGILSVYSVSYVLVLGAYYKLQTFLYLTANGVVQGMRPIIGYNYGAGEMKRVNKIFKTALEIIVVVMTIGTVLCMSMPQHLIGLFSKQTSTIEIGCTTLRIIAIGFIVSSVSVTASGALEGLGKGMESLMISILRYIAVMLSLAYVFSMLIGVNGVWHAFWVTEAITAIISFCIYKKTIKNV